MWVIKIVELTKNLECMLIVECSTAGTKGGTIPVFGVILKRHTERRQGRSVAVCVVLEIVLSQYESELGLLVT